MPPLHKMSWPIKVSFRPNQDKEFSKEARINPSSPVLDLLFSACTIFEIVECQDYELLYLFHNLSTI